MSVTISGTKSGLSKCLKWKAWSLSQLWHSSRTCNSGMDWVEWNIKHNHSTVSYFKKKWSNGKKISFGVLRDCCLVVQSCLTVCDPIDCSLPEYSVLGISQARILAWVAISSSRGSSRSGVIPGSPALALHHWATREDHLRNAEPADILLVTVNHDFTLRTEDVLLFFTDPPSLRPGMPSPTCTTAPWVAWDA